MKRNYIITLCVISALLLSTFFVATSYGLWKVTKASPLENEVQSGCFNIIYTDGTHVEVDPTFSMSDADGNVLEPYTFAVENICSNEAVLSVKLNILDGSNIKPSALKVALSGDATLETTVLQNLNEDSTEKDGVSSSRVLSTVTLPAGKVSRGSFRIWVDQNAAFLEDAPKFIGELEVVAEAKTLKNEYADASGANRPILNNGMIPVTWNGTNWIKADISKKWYDYEEQWWANAVNVKEEQRSVYLSNPVGSVIPMDDIIAMWVWVPKYEYQYTNLGNGYASGSAEYPGEIKIRFISKNTTVATPNYNIHDAFWWDDNGDGKKDAGEQLSGIWVSKFEISAENSMNNSLQSPRIKPNVSSWRGASIGTFYTSIKDYMNGKNGTSIYGLTNADTHMIKNMEWGAIAYLTQSKYGKYGNADYSEVEKEIYSNNSSNYVTGRSGGKADTSSSYGTYSYDGRACSTKECVTEEISAKKDAYGASTTGNIYGIYDMSGGAKEYVMSLLKTKSENVPSVSKNSLFTGKAVDGKDVTGKYELPQAKYYHLYSYNTSSTELSEYFKGDATMETKGWYQESFHLFTNEFPFLCRHGIFSLDASNGDANREVSTRAVSIVFKKN